MNDSERIIIKPSVNSCSGRGIYLFERSGNEYLTPDKKIKFNSNFIESYGSDFIVQEAVRQHQYMSQFCKTAVNTLRVATYRSVIDDQVHVIGSIMRIGRDGSYVDNAHAGGCYVGIDKETGEIGHCLYDQFGNSTKRWNGIDYENNSFKIPYWEEVVKLAKYIGAQHQHMRLLAQDIAIDDTGKPVLIEANVADFSYWLFMFTGKIPLGEFTNEIIDYCAKEKDKLHLGFFKII